jgi:hypothetical protein
MILERLAEPTGAASDPRRPWLVALKRTKTATAPVLMP